MGDATVGDEKVEVYFENSMSFKGGVGTEGR